MLCGKHTRISRAVINSSPLAIYTIDARGDVRSWNPAAEALYGWSADDVMGRPLPMITKTRKTITACAIAYSEGDTARDRNHHAQEGRDSGHRESRSRTAP